MKPPDHETARLPAGSALAVRRADGTMVAIPAHLARALKAAAPATQTQKVEAKPLEVAFFFDTTGSMYPYFDRARSGIARIIERLAKEQVRAVFAVYAYKNHGDEQDLFSAHPFVHLPHTSDPAILKEWLGEVWKGGGGGGGDALCAIEDALHHLNHAVPAGPAAATRAAVIIGDMPPHGVVDRLSGCPHEFDYREEVMAIHRKGYTCYSVYCAEKADGPTKRREKIREYYRWLAKATGGKFLELDELDSVVDVILGICMKETGHLDRFVAEAFARPALPPATRKLLLALKAPGT